MLAQGDIMTINARDLGLWNNACLAFKTNPEIYLEKNNTEANKTYKHGRLEKIGNAFVWHVQHLPFKVYKHLTDPRVVTIATTIFTIDLLCNKSCCNYPS